MGTGSELYAARNESSTNAFSNLPTDLRLATEDRLEKEASQNEEDKPEASGLTLENDYGVRSLQDTILEKSQPGNSKVHGDDEGEENTDGRRRFTIRPSERSAKHPFEELSQAFQKQPLDSPVHTPAMRSSRQHSISHSITSLSVDSQAPLSSAPSSPKSVSNRSLRPSDEESIDDSSSQAIASSSEDDALPSTADSAPQLIMPSIRMPSRRPFTARGKEMGRLKILVAGDSGVGKSSLIKSIIQSCEDIVHVDTMASDLIGTPRLRKAKVSQDASSIVRSNHNIMHVHASTKPFPSWWADVEETRILPKRRNTGDTVLERNLCFVDTAGYGSGLSKMQAIESVIRYIESQVISTFAKSNRGESDLVGLLSGSGGSQVDLVLYLVSQDFKHEDILFLDRLSKLSNVIPVISKSDTMSSEEIEVLRRSLTKQLQSAGIRTFVPIADNAGQMLYSVCCSSSCDQEVMDASLLMSSEYLQPLVPSELNLLIQHIFGKESISCLRHLASKKLVNKCRSLIPKALPALPASPSLSPYMEAKIADHIRQEERLAQLKLAQWASELQRNLQSERAEYKATVSRERSAWLLEKLDQSTDQSDGKAIALAPTLSNSKIHPPGSILPISSAIPAYHRHHSILNAGDPLGLLGWHEALKRHGWIAFQVAGSFGILGAIAVWAAKTWEIGAFGYGNGEEESWVWRLLTGDR